jgi:hypothetical protein
MMALGSPSRRTTWGLVVAFDEVVDGGLQGDEGVKAAALELATGELGEEPLDGVEP